MTPAAEEPLPEVPLHRALGLTDDEFEAVGKILGRPPNHLELALYAVMWSEHCSYKSSRMHLKRLPTEGPQGAGRPRGERRGDRRRRRHRHRHPHREPQPPLGDRAVSRSGHRRRGDPARHLHHGRPPAGHHGPAVLRVARRRPPALADGGRGQRDLGLRQLGRRAHRRRRADLRPLLRPEPVGQRPVHGCPADRPPGARHRVGPGQPGRAARQQHRARRHRRRERAGLGRLRRHDDGGSRRPTTPSAPACRWATPSRRSASSRPASSSWTRSWWWGSRISAVPAWPAPPARRPAGAASAWTSTSPPCLGAKRAWSPGR